MPAAARWTCRRSCAPWRASFQSHSVRRPVDGRPRWARGCLAHSAAGRRCVVQLAERSRRLHRAAQGPGRSSRPRVSCLIDASASHLSACKCCPGGGGGEGGEGAPLPSQAGPTRRARRGEQLAEQAAGRRCMRAPGWPLRPLPGRPGAAGTTWGDAPAPAPPGAQAPGRPPSSGEILQRWLPIHA
jgi:hypothetical protein